MSVNARSSEYLGTARQKLMEVDHKFEKARADAKKAKEQIEQVMQNRHKLFSNAFNYISKKIDRIWKERTPTAAFPIGGTAS